MKKINEATIRKYIVEAICEILCGEDGSEEAPQYPSYEEFEQFVNGKMTIFEFHNEETDDYDIIHFDYNVENGTLNTGSVSNGGFSPDGQVSIPVENGDFQKAIEALYEEIAQIEAEKGFN